MTTKDAASEINGWHAHVYFDTASSAEAQQVREEVQERFDVKMGRWHERTIGPHPAWSYQIAFTPDTFSAIVPWLTLNRLGLSVLVHPETGDDIPDHTDHAIWLGEKLSLNLEALR